MDEFGPAEENTPLVGISGIMQQGQMATLANPNIQWKLGASATSMKAESSPGKLYPSISPVPTYDECTFVRTFEIHHAPISINGTIECAVCQRTVELAGRRHQYVVKCHSCQEAMPIRKAPPGKKYVRCSPPCNCLMICRQNSTKIKCPRENCQRTLQLDRPEPRNLFLQQAIPGIRRVECGHCYECFLWNVEYNMFSRCPHCHRYSSINKQHKQRKSLKFIILGILLMAIAIAVTVTTLKQLNFKVWFIAIYVGLFAIAAVLLGRGVFLLTMKESRADLLA